MKAAFKFLRYLYADSVPDVANLLVAEAERDVETVKVYLLSVRNYIDYLLKEIHDENTENSTPSGND